jgi:hypothetical protein
LQGTNLLRAEVTLLFLAVHLSPRPFLGSVPTWKSLSFGLDVGHLASKMVFSISWPITAFEEAVINYCFDYPFLSLTYCQSVW